MELNHWSAGLLRTLKNPKNYIITSPLAVVIADKFPKAKHHYLVLPWEDIPTIYALKSQHLPTLNDMYMLALNILEVRNQNINKFLIGFHAQPNMQRLHLHVISKDFISDSLKTKKQWNSFNTDLFLKFNDVYEQVKHNGYVHPVDKHMIKQLQSTTLLCNQCDMKPTSFPHLKFHLQEHEILDASDDDDVDKIN